MRFDDLRSRAITGAREFDPRIPRVRVPPHWFVILSVCPEFHAFDGAQIWCASISKARPTGHALDRDRWTEGDFRRARQILDQVLEGAGDPSRQRLCSTLSALYLLRVLRQEEHVEGMVKNTADMRIGFAPNTIHEDVGMLDRVSGLPCESPSVEHPPDHPDFKIALDCGTCVPCRARAFVSRTMQPCPMTREEFIAWERNRNV